MTDYDFRSLSPIDFEVLVRDLLNAVLGLKLESFAVGPDGGIDLRHLHDSKTTIVQCKHRPDIKKRGLVRSAAAEAKRWPNAPAEMDSYHFVVSGDLTPGAVDAAVCALKPLPVEASGVWHRGSLNAALARHPEVERDHFKLWLSGTAVLDRIANAAQWQRSEALLTQVKDRVRLYVHTPAYGAAMKVLEAEHVLIVAGPPGVGKSTLAEMALLTLWQQGWTVVNIANDIDEAWNRVRGAGTGSEKIVFYYDDFLGQTNLIEVQKNEAAGIAQLLDAIRRSNGDLRLIVTSREQILNQAQAGADDRLRRLLPDDAKFRVVLDEIDRGARARMLFNHIHFGFHGREERKLLARDTRYREVIDHRGFNPRVLESVALRQHHASVDDFYAALLHAIAHPGEIWAGSFLQLSTAAMDILFQLATTSATSVPLDDVRAALVLPDPREWESALKVLEGTWIRLQAPQGVVSLVGLFDPSRRDYLLDLLDDPSYFDHATSSIKAVSHYYYLMQLAGFLVPKGSWRRRDTRSELRKNFDDLLPTLDSELTRLAAGEWATLEVQLARVTAQFATESAGLVMFRKVDMAVMASRMDLLTQVAEICFESALETPTLSAWLKETLDSGGARAGEGTMVTASDALRLVNPLVCDDAPDWAADHAVLVMTDALGSLGGTDEIRAFGELPGDFRSQLDPSLVSIELTRAFDDEIMNIGMETDSDNAAAWLDEVASLAAENEIPLDTEDLEHEIANLVHRGRHSQPPPAAIKDAVGQSDGSDESLAVLFAKLA